MNTKELDSKYIAGTYARFPIVLKEGCGSVVWDTEAGVKLTRIRSLSGLDRR